MNWKEYCNSKYLAPEELSSWAKGVRREKKTIATLNGSFDLLHPGHLYMIYEAAKCADLLLLLLNSDESIKGYKGPSRPICPLEQRLLMVSALHEVSFVSWFIELDPRAVLAKIAPDVHVNGAEYGANCIEAEVVMANGGRIHLVDRIGDFSSSKMIKRNELCV